MTNARFEEGSGITIDTEVEAGATGWSLGYTAINRVGALVALHLEATHPVGSGAGTNAVHAVATSGVPAGGSAIVTYSGKAPITVPFNCSSSALQTLLDGIFGAGNTLVAGGPLPTGLTVTFQGTLAHQPVALPVVNDAGLTGGTTPHLTVTNSVVGVLPASPALVCTLPADFAPGATVADPSGKFLVHADGTITFPGSTAAGGTDVLQVTYEAGALTP